MTDLDSACQRGLASLDRETRKIEPEEPFVGAILNARRTQGLSANPRKLFAHWSSQSIGSEVSKLRYPWLLDHERYVKPPSYAGRPESWRAWRASEHELAKDAPFKLQTRLSLPVVLANNCELLLQALETPLKAEAEHLLSSVLPRARRDFASFVQARNPWADTFALWCLAQQPRLFNRLRPIALAVAVSYAELALATDGIVTGARFPFRHKRLCSGSAHLAFALFQLGLDLPLVSSLVSFLQEARHDDGGFGDGDDPSDPLTTLVAADFLASLLPDFDCAPTVEFLLAQQESEGWWCANGPERPWLTSKVLSFLSRTTQPFAQRFRWPPCQGSELDPKTGLARFSYFVGLTELFSSLPGLSSCPLELGFLDLAKFKRFNDGYGQDEGDRVLRVLAEHLGQCPDTLTVRDGGDEYLILGSPGASGLEQRLNESREAWPAVFRREFGDEATVVAPRILITTTPAGQLMAARETLGRGITGLKDEIPGPSGVLKVVE